MISKSYFSPGKLLITSEYFVLDGALALAVPTVLGQEMSVNEILNNGNTIIWEAFHENKFWLKVKIDYVNWKILETNIPSAAEFILKVFKEIYHLSSEKFSGNSYEFRTNLQFPPDFGLGSSSTLMNNLADWANIDAFLLNEKSLGGSGYDIAVAKEKSPILFKKSASKSEIEKIEFKPCFSDELILVHLNQKQDSRKGIDLYRSKIKSDGLVKEFSDLTKAVLEAKNIDKFSDLMEIHESKVSSFLNIKTVKEQLFPDLPVFIKSLGAWGGDFVLTRKFQNYQEYFAKKGFNSMYKWNEIVQF
ncbi:GYDIA family GHMP kinase [Halpernia frigidisoli]|uniref:Mevalonate kinase n=1 Tax=Halpernia frigidisoli TaxID=1125876 RepID=A0A1I3GK26_9FLAO|nr:GYDIA family GHMP kinase [Halpernia frigidisoli]SFI23824.1 Mevalonate kinase [Halpernia frigidisoli]